MAPHRSERLTQIEKFLAGGPSFSADEIAKGTGLTNPVVQNALTYLVARQLVIKQKDFGRRHRYSLAPNRGHTKQGDILPPELLANRIDRLKYMRKHLIVDHHPLLTDLIKDYELMLFACDPQPALLEKEDEATT